MAYKIIAIFLLTAQSLVANEFNDNSLKALNYKFIQTLDYADNGISKFYKLSYPGKIKPSHGLISIKNIGGNFTHTPVYIAEGGMIWFNAHNETIEGIFGFDGGYGEKFEILLTTMDTKGKVEPLAKCEIIPFPRIIQDAKGHRIELQAMTADGQSFLFIGSGFAPKEKLSFKSRSCHESLTHSVNVDNNGIFYMEYCPAIIGQNEGPFEVTFSGENMNPLKIRHYWGKIAFTPPKKYTALKSKYKLPVEQPFLDMTKEKTEQHTTTLKLSRHPILECA